ncbi:MAG: sporulation protein YunB [Bacilli bacterium]|nr:sporulation protein YunB [Bacilli bacterium]
MKLKKKKSLKKKIFIIILLIIINSLLLIYYISNKVMPTIMITSKNIIKETGMTIISENVSDKIISILDKEELFYIEKDINGNIESIDYNTKVVNEILKEVSIVSYNNFKKYEKEKDGVITYVPIFSGSKNIFFSNLGPKVPIKLILDGNVVTSLQTDVREYGYNSALIEISVRIEANTEVVLPFKTSNEKIVNIVPVSIKIVEGDVTPLLDSNNVSKTINK